MPLEVDVFRLHGFRFAHPAVMIHVSVQRLHPQLFVSAFTEALCIAVRVDAFVVFDNTDLAPVPTRRCAHVLI
jgi:hypothetical protein